MLKGCKNYHHQSQDDPVVANGPLFHSRTEGGKRVGRSGIHVLHFLTGSARSSLLYSQPQWVRRQQQATS